MIVRTGDFIFSFVDDDGSRVSVDIRSEHRIAKDVKKRIDVGEQVIDARPSRVTTVTSTQALLALIETIPEDRRSQVLRDFVIQHSEQREPS